MTDDPMFADFERDGEDVIRKNLAASLYQERKAKLAREWLYRKERERNNASNAEQIRIARSAKNAAWAAAIAAIIAAICAAVAIAISFLRP